MTLVFIHGAGGTSMTWHLQLLRFSDVVAIELPGHPTGVGFSSIQDYSQHVAELLDKNKITNPILVGHSMGGAIAIELALRNSSLSALVLVGTGARLRVRQDILAKISENYPEAAKLIARWSVSPNCDPIIIDRIAQEMLKVRAEVTYGDFLACDKFDRMSEVASIRQRTLVICGADDLLTPPKYSQYLHEKILDSRLVLIPGAGHIVMLEKHREFNRALEDFLGSG